MPGTLSNFGLTELVDHIFNAAYTPPAAVYLVLSTADPTKNATGAACNEVANTNGYARTAITYGAAASRQIVQNAPVTFPQATGPWGTVTHWCIADSPTYGAGNILAIGQFTAPFSPVSGNTPTIPTSDSVIEVLASAGSGFPTAIVHSLLNLMFRNVAFASPAGNTFIALINTLVDDADVTMLDVTESSGTNYARVEVNPNGGASPAWNLASDGALDNADLISWPTPGAGGWTQVVSMAVVDALTGTGANILAYDNDNVVDQTPADGDTVQVVANGFDVALN